MDWIREISTTYTSNEGGTHTTQEEWDMEKSEFEERIGKEISGEHYKIVETVYSYYPGITDMKGKDQVADLYKQFGIIIFADMLRRAGALEQFALKKSQLNAKIGRFEVMLFPLAHDGSDEVKHG
jgi:hypothetical protein